MISLRLIAPFLLTLISANAAAAQTATMENGGDTFISGETVVHTLDTQGDTFVAARSASTRGATSGDLHIAGFDVSVSAETTQDLYAAGATVVVRGAVGEDLTAVGFSVRTEPTSEARGNARLVANTITVEGPVLGALTATGSDVILNAPVSGDVRIMAGAITFGPEATIGGALTYTSDREIDVPERVLPPERVRFERADLGSAWDELDEIRKDMPVLPTFMSMLSGFLISLLFFVALGAICLGFFPKRTEAMRRRVSQAPGRAIVLGIIGLSMLFGMVPITAITIVGLPVVPIAILAIVVAWVFGYALGAYSVAMRIWLGLGGREDIGNMGRLLVFAGAISFIALLNFIPFVGWVANYTLVLIGVGGLANAIFAYFIDDPDGAFDVDVETVKD